MEKQFKLKNWLGIILLMQSSLGYAAVPSCEVNRGLILVSQSNPPLVLINEILSVCDKQMPNDANVLMLHGLLERQQGLHTKNFAPAIHWFQKGVALNASNALNFQLELAVTYEWAGQYQKANALYASILSAHPELRPALLGKARLLVNAHQYAEAKKIYADLLKINPSDTSAMNGQARLEMAEKHFSAAKKQFHAVLAIAPNNPDALIGLQQLKAATAHKKTIKQIIKKPFCQANKGLALLNEKQPPIEKINFILSRCDQTQPNDVQTLLLHGLLAREQAKTTQQYDEAIRWLVRAVDAAPNQDNPLLALAVTYEWANQPEKAQQCYQTILAREPNNRAALLGLARVYRSLYELKKASAIYQSFLQKNPNDIDAMNGEAMIHLANYQTKPAELGFNQVLSLQKNNQEALAGLAMLPSVRPSIFSFNQGQYVVGGQTAQMTNLGYTTYLDAINQVIFNLQHNSNELQLDSVIDPGVLPKNSVFAGWQHQYPYRYGVGVNVEYRERTQFRDEYRIGVNTNYYIKRNLQWFAGARQGFPSPWNNKLFYTGLNVLTNLPVDVGVSGYWGRQQYGGSTSAYGLDLRKEFSMVSYYDVGASYSPSQTSWEIHSLFIFPIFKYQGLEASYNHLYFNGASIYALGWRINY